MQANKMDKINDTNYTKNTCDNSKIDIKDKKKVKIRYNIYSRVLSSQNLSKQPIIDNGKIIIHIHGGGFIGMSSRSH